MKKLSFFLMAMLFSVMSFAATETISCPAGTVVSSKITMDFKSLTFLQEQGSSTSAVKAYSPWRIYKNHKVTFTPQTDVTIENLVITCAGSDYAKNGTLTNATATLSGTTLTITPTDGTQAFTFAATVAQVRWQKIVVTYKVAGEVVAVEAPKFDVTTSNFTEAFSLNITSAEGTTLKYTTDTTDPATSATAVVINTNTATVAIPAKSTMVRAIAIKGEDVSEEKETTYCYVNSPATAYTVAEAMEVIDAGLGLTNELYVKGEISTIEKYDANYGSITYWIKDEEGNKFECYSGLGLNKAKFTKKEDLVVGSKVVVCGVMKKYNTTYEFNYNNYIVSLELPVVKFNVTVTAENGTVEGAGEYEEGKEATLTATAAEGYEFTCWTSGEDTVSTANPYTFAVTANVALVANFEKTAPATETIYFINTKKWAKVNAYAWNTNGNNGWPGAAATKEAEQIAGFDVYSFTANAGQYANVIFNNKVGDTGSQTEDLVWTAGKYYWMGVAKNFAGATKEEAEATLAAPLPDAWNIVGDAGLMGKGWDLNAAENAMTLQADGTYLLEKKDITITAGSYEYKAAKDHGWDVSVPAGSSNQKLTISKSGIYDVTFVLDVTAKKLTATATLKKEAVVIPTVVIAGDMNSWSQTKDKFTMSADSLTATFKATLAVKNYGFKMIVGGAWHSDGKTITRAANSTKFTGANSNTNSTLKADIAGEYLFTWEYATKTLTVTYPALPVKYNVTVTAENGTVTGAGTYEEGKEATLTATAAEGYEFTCWTVGEDTVSTANPYKFTVTADLALVANFELIPPTKYNVTVTAENGTVEGAGEYEENAEATLTATAAEGYEFVNWTVGDSIVSTENPYKFTVTADLALVANFKEVVKAIEVKVTDATATSGEWSIDLAGSWNDQALTIKLWQDNTQGFGSYAPNTETGYYILLGAKELTPTTEGVYADNGDGTFTFTCSATEGTTQYNITVTGTSGAQEVYYETFELTNLEVTDNETFLVLSASDMNMGLEVMLSVNMDGTLMDASQILFGEEVLPILSSEPVTVTFNEELLTDVYTARVVVEHKGGPLGLELIMYAGGATSEPIAVNVIGATAAVDEATDVLKITGNWDGIAFELRINTYDPAQTLYDAPQIAEFETEEVYATSSLVTVIKTGENIDVIGEFMSPMGDIYNVYVNATFAAGPETGVDNINTTIAPVKVIENGQIFIISNGVKYNAQGAQL